MLRTGAPLVCMALVLAACTGSGSSTDVVAPDTTPSTAPTTTTSTTAAPEVDAPAFVDEPELLPVLEGLEVVSAISAGKMVDLHRPDAVIQQGVDGAGDAPDETREIGRTFTGADPDVLINMVGSDEELNPAGQRFAFQAVDVVLSASEFGAIQNATESFSWNILQRGLAGNNGGQWKMSLVNESDGTVTAQCVVRDEDNRLMRVNSSYKMSPAESTTITCVFDDATNSLQVDVNGQTDSPTDVVRKNVEGVEQETEEPFGDSEPDGGAMCGGVLDAGIGSVIAIGNKPACGITLTADDRFQGTIQIARLWR